MNRFQHVGPTSLHLFAFCCLLGWFALSLTGCAKSPNAEVESRNKTADESLTIGELTSRGLPDISKEWSSDDMTTAVAVFTKIAQEGHQQLPRFQSERSGKAFARLISRENLEQFKNKSLPMESRFPQALQFYLQSNEIYKLYIAGFVRAQVRDTEIVELTNLIHLISAAMLDLVDEFWPTISPADPTYQARLDGLAQMKSGLAQIVMGGLITLTERSHFRDAELQKLVSCMLETFPQLVPRLLPEARTEALDRLAQLNADAKLEYLQPGLKELQKRVQAAVAKAAVEEPATSGPVPGRRDVLKTVQQVIAEQLELKLEDVRPDATLAQLKMDDLDFVEVVMVLEEKLNVYITDESVNEASGGFNTKGWLQRLKVQDLVKIVAAAQQKPAGKPSP